MSSLLLVVLAVVTSVFAQSDVRLPPNVIIPDSPKVVYKNQKADFSLPCQAKGIPEPSYEWLRGGIPLIVSPQITFDSVKGDITFNDFTTREEGVFTCVARSMFGTTTVKSFAPTYTLKQSRVEEFKTNATSSVVAEEYSYTKLECANKGEAVGEEIGYNWYDFSGNQIKIEDRHFIDQKGTLHFSYVTTADGNVRQYKCGISATGLSYIQLGGIVLLTIKTIASPTAISPQIQYTNSGTKFIRFTTATLECFFSGYDPQYPNVPATKWYFDDGNEIIATGRYSFSADHRRLIISNVDEADEKNYYCQAQNTRGTSNKEAVFLDVTSSPIFYPNGAPVDQTISEGKDAVFNCNARSARGETEPDYPVWYINGQQVGSQTDKTKFVFTDGNKKLTIRSLKKATDIMCIQCSVSNPVGTTWADGCLNVLLPITILKQPAATQEIDHGDTIDLTVTATTDPSQNLTYRWKHNNTESLNPPPFVIYNPSTREAHINTSNLNTDQYESVRGIYIINVTHVFDYHVVEVNVILKDKPKPDSVAQGATFDMWIIGLIIGLILLILVVILIIFIICRKQQEGAYNVDKKETGAGLDPEKELKDKGFDDYSRPVYNEDYDFPNKPPNKADLEYDDVPIGDDESLGEYGYEADTHFNEDGSFIGIYQKREPQPPPHATESTI
ncbi:neural cell adhesion molecule L1-like [Physella acuta]|uniref:neural cell adhesion molecule L1-like n=1 Tax=Physella acuta TaxID=109671 RepID=UPI0027DD9A7E|nr:neural cell adhesion molecule L1-like [Physella acuta]XP_059158073.1 neural cell adhesion molecule L1-like [Physella acuta]XP_059158074.1 neural cell adhesion molecule L1-like [Physella acuta]